MLTRRVKYIRGVLIHQIGVVALSGVNFGNQRSRLPYGDIPTMRSSHWDNKNSNTDQESVPHERIWEKPLLATCATKEKNIDFQCQIENNQRIEWKVCSWEDLHFKAVLRRHERTHTGENPWACVRNRWTVLLKTRSIREAYVIPRLHIRGAHSKKFVSKLVQLQFKINESI